MIANGFEFTFAVLIRLLCIKTNSFLLNYPDFLTAITPAIS